MSGSFDVDALADAIAALFSSMTPPSGQSNLTTATADLPDAIVQDRVRQQAQHPSAAQVGVNAVLAD